VLRPHQIVISIQQLEGAPKGAPFSGSGLKGSTLFERENDET
jgi:hypothetical protein